MNLDNSKTRTSYGKTWLLVFHHVASPVKFNSSMCLHSDEEGKYNHFGSISNIFKINGYFEFILEYPGSREITWKQNVSPIDVTESNLETDDIGLIITHNKNNLLRFRGLMKSSSGACYDGDGSEIGYCKYSIGQISTAYDGIPGPVFFDGSQETWSTENWVKVWIRVPAGKFTCRQNKYHNNNTFLILTVFISMFVY